MTQPLPLTPEGLTRLQAALQREQARRDEARRVVQEQMEANENESLDLAAAQEALSGAEARIGELEDQLARAVLLAPSGGTPGQAALGSRVRLLHVDLGREIPLQLVSAAEVAAGPGEHGAALVSSESPVGRALLGRRAGDEFVVDLGRVEARYRVLTVEE